MATGQPRGVGGFTGGVVGLIRRFSRPSLLLLPLLALAVSCSETPTGAPKAPWVVFDDAGVILESVEVGRDTTFSVPITFNFIPRDRPLYFAATDARFRVSPESWDPSDRLPEELEVRFFPTVADTYHAWVQVVSSDEVVGEVSVGATVWSPWSSVQVESGRVLFTSMEPGGVSIRTLKVGNSFLASLPCSLDILEPPQGVVVRPLHAVLAPGEWRDFEIQLTCEGEVFHRDDVIILSNDPFQSRVRVEVAGDCKGTPELEGWPTEIDFLDTALLVGKTRSLTITNVGNGTFIMEPIGPPSEFSIRPERFIVAPGATQILHVRWLPERTGPVTGTLEWTTNTEVGDVAIAFRGVGIHGIVPAESVGGIKLAMGPDAVAREFGPPDWVWCEPGCGVSWNYEIEDAVLFDALPDDCCTLDLESLAREIAGWNTFTGRTAGGIGMGSTTLDVMLEFGNPPVIDDTGATLWWAYPEDGILFMFIEERVYLVDVFRPEDWAGDSFRLTGPPLPGAWLPRRLP